MRSLTRLEYLRSHLLPAGTPMKDVPPDFRGLIYAEYMELQWLEYCEEKNRNTAKRHPAVLEPEDDGQMELKASA